MRRYPKISPLAASLALLLPSLAASAAEFDMGSGKLAVNGSIYLGTIKRTSDRNPELIPAVNATLVGATGTAVGGKNQDDGNLNFDKGDLVSTTLKGLLEVELKQGSWGVMGRAMAWHDFALTDGARPWGNLPNGLTAGQPLSDAPFQRRAKFSGIVLDDLYVYGRTDTGAGALDWKLGQYSLDWGNRFTITGGLGDISPRDNAAQRRAGALLNEISIPVPGVSAQWAVSPATTLDAFAQLAFRPNAALGCGTFFAQVDFVSDGCDKALLGVASDRASLTAGAYISRAPNADTSNSGQFGIGVRHKIDTLDAEVGFYAAQYHSRAAYFSAIKTQRATGAPFVPGNAGGLNPQYFVEYPEDIRVFAVTAEKKWKGGGLLVEASYRPNQPFQYNAVDLLNAFVTPAGATPLRAGATNTPLGGVFAGYERHKTAQLNIAVNQALPGVLGAAMATVGGEFAYKEAGGIGNGTGIRFRRGDVYGQAPVGGAACAANMPAYTCSFGGYVSSNAFGYRLRGGLRYAAVMPGVDLLPSLAFGHDVSGWSEDGSLNEGRQFAILSLRAEIHKAFQAELSWQPIWGGTYNHFKDRDVVSLSIGYRF